MSPLLCISCHSLAVEIAPFSGEYCRSHILLVTGEILDDPNESLLAKAQARVWAQAALDLPSTPPSYLRLVSAEAAASEDPGAATDTPSTVAAPGPSSAGGSPC